MRLISIITENIVSYYSTRIGCQDGNPTESQKKLDGHHDWKYTAIMNEVLIRRVWTKCWVDVITKAAVMKMVQKWLL